jgi:outer membrane immunogenic protein
MIAWILRCNFSSGKFMTKLLFRLCISAAALTAVAPVAFAADYEPPPPPEIRATDWSGPYIGGFVGGTFVEGGYDTGVDPEMSGAGAYGGILGGWNVQFDSLVVGVEADYGWGFDTTAQNRDPAEATELTIDGVGTIRARLGWADDDTLIYATGGYGWMKTTIDALVGPLSIPDDDSATHDGWVVGGGIEHRVLENLSLRAEYLYGEFSEETYTLEDGLGNGGDLDLTLDSVHFVRAALVYNFGGLW